MAENGTSRTAKARARVFLRRPGALPNHMSPAAVRAGGRTRSRNELLANHMLDRPFMVKRGRDWMVMKRTMAEFNGTEPELEHDEASRFVTVTFSNISE